MIFDRFLLCFVGLQQQQNQNPLKKVIIIQTVTHCTQIVFSPHQVQFHLLGLQDFFCHLSKITSKHHYSNLGKYFWLLDPPLLRNMTKKRSVCIWIESMSRSDECSHKQKLVLFHPQVAETVKAINKAK